MDEVLGFVEEQQMTTTVQTTSNEVPAKVQGTSLEVVDSSGRGMEGLSMEEQLTPFLRIVQKGSPQVDPSAPEYMEAARPGMILNTATGELYPGATGVEVVVCFRDFHYGAWVPRDSGGGFRGMKRPEDPIIRQLKAKHGPFKKLPGVTDDGEAVDYVETIQLGVLYADRDLDAYNAQRALIAFTSTALQMCKQYITKHNSWRYQDAHGKGTVADIWQYKWRFYLVPHQKDSYSWFGWKIERIPATGRAIDALIKRTDPLDAMGEEFYDLFTAGAVKADHTGDAAASDDEIPF